MEKLIKPIPGYENLYCATDDGQILSIERFQRHSSGKGLQKNKKKFLKQYNRNGGYNTVALSKDGKAKTFFVHKLIAIAFLGESPGMVVDHINRIKTDNRIENLRYCTQRDNCKNTSVRSATGYTGVYINPPNYRKRFITRIKIKGKNKYLGCYETAEEANIIYQQALKELKNGK